MNTFIALYSSSPAGSSLAHPWVRSNYEHLVSRGEGVVARSEGTGPVHFVDERASLAVVADARLDDRETLRARLQSRRRACSDAELIMSAYERWGDRCVDYLGGDYAFAVWDWRTHRLLSARSASGVKPLYFVDADDVVACGTSIQTLLTLPGVTRGVNEDQILAFLLGLVPSTEETFYDDVRRLAPGSTLVADADGMRIETFWELDEDLRIRLGSDAEYAEQYRELFYTSVERRLNGATRPGAHLSGGLDSSSIVGAARAALDATGDSPLDTFSLIFSESSQCDERPYIEAVVNQGGVRPHYVDGDATSPLDALDRMLRVNEEPFTTPNLFMYWALYERVRDVGIDMLLDGFAGDNVVGHGDRYLTEMASRLRVSSVSKALRDVTYQALAPRSSRRRRARMACGLLAEYVWRPLVQERVSGIRASIRRDGAIPKELIEEGLVAPGFARRISEREPDGWRERSAPRMARSVRGTQYADLCSGIIPYAVETASKAARAFGIQLGFPFVDTSLIEYCYALPPTQKYREGWTRFFAREGMRDFLPEQVYRRYGKTYLNESMEAGLFERGRRPLEGYVHERMQLAGEYVDVATARVFFSTGVEQPAVRSELAWPLLRAVVLTRWLEVEQEVCSSGTGRANGVLRMRGVASTIETPMA